MKKIAKFHVVRRCHEGATTYAIYVDNRPYLEPGRGYSLGRAEARWIAKFLNGGAA